MKKLIVIVFLLIVLAAGGVGAWIYLNKEAAAGTAVVADVPEADPIYVEFNPLQLPIIGDGGVEQLVTVVVALEVVDEAASRRVIALAPRLNDGFMQELYGKLYDRTMIRANGVVDVSVLKSQIVQVSERVLGPNVVRDALVQMVSQRPM